MPELTENLRADYRRMLSIAAESGQGQFVGNRYPWQCQTAIEELSRFALQKQARSSEPVRIRILTATFPNYVFGCPASFESLKMFLSKGGQIQVLIWNKEYDRSNALAQIAPAFAPRFELRLSGTDDLADQLGHFFIVDDLAYRLEQPHQPVPPEKFSHFHPEIPAKITFNDQKGGKELVKFFDDIWHLCRAQS